MLKKDKNRLPTEQEMLAYIPKRSSIDWEEKEGLIKLKVPKFEGNFGKSFCNLVRKENYFEASLDKIGSIVWKNCDGKKSVEDILKILKKEFPKEENIANRLYLFLQQIDNLGYIDLR